jgi:hypothetical protein
MNPDDPVLQRRDFLRGGALAAGVVAAAPVVLVAAEEFVAPQDKARVTDPLARMVEIAERCGPELGFRATRR